MEITTEQFGLFLAAVMLLVPYWGAATPFPLPDAQPGPSAAIVEENDEWFGPIRKCPRGLTDVELSRCFGESVLEMGQNGLLQSGIPEIDLKPMDPFEMDSFNYTFNQMPPLVATIRFKRIAIRGLGGFNKAAFEFNTTARRLGFTLGAPQIVAEAQYVVDGNLPLLRTIGSGPASIVIKDGRLKGDAGIRIDRDAQGKKIMQIESLELIMDYADGQVDIKGIFGPTQSLQQAGELVAWFIDRFQHQLHELIRPVLERRVAAIAKRVANKSLAKMNFVAEFF